MVNCRRLRFAIPFAAMAGLLAAIDLHVVADDQPAENQPATAKASARTPEQIFVDLDKNGDGKLSAEEVPSEQQRLFERLVRVAGKNKGSDLTRSEFLEVFKADDFKVAAPQNLGGQVRGNGFDPSRFFQRMDRNQDGKLTLDEIPELAPPGIKQLFTRLKKPEITREEFLQGMRGVLGGNPAGGFMRDPEAFFKRLNPNAEGQIVVANAPAELRPQVERWLSRLGRGQNDSLTFDDVKTIVAQNQSLKAMRPGGGMVNRPGAAPRPGEGRGGFSAFLLRKLDTNGDGKLSNEEFSKAAELFEELDRNHDELLEASELLVPSP